jgi:NADPH-dependent ferric siderophore reductase
MVTISFAVWSSSFHSKSSYAAQKRLTKDASRYIVRSVISNDIVPQRHNIERVRRETRRRSVTIASIAELTPRMRRITFTGDLADFESASYDDHIKLYFPLQPGGDETLARNITPRSFRPADAALTVDIALHDGPIGNWARDAVAGAPAWIGGPRGSYVIPMDFDWYLLTGDETALPAIGRRLEELPAGARVFVIAEVSDAAEEQRFSAPAGASITWLHRGGDAASTPSGLPQAIAAFTPPPGDGYVWVACESESATHIRAELVARGLPKDWLRVAAYWKRNVGDVHETLND